MGQPNPPGDIPLIEGLGPEWNDIVSAIPEEQRATLGPVLKERISAFEPLKQWEDLHRSGITPQQAGTALDTIKYIESNPRDVYDAIAKHLNITPAQAQELEKELDEADSSDPRVARLQETVETLTQIALAQRQQTTQEKLAEQAEKEIDAELAAVKKKYGDHIPDEEIIMRMVHKNISAEDAFKEADSYANEVRRRRPAPYVMGANGTIPNRAIDPTKLDSKGTKDVVAQMLDHANSERNRS